MTGGDPVSWFLIDTGWKVISARRPGAPPEAPPESAPAGRPEPEPSSTPGRSPGEVAP